MNSERNNSRRPRIALSVRVTIFSVLLSLFCASVISIFNITTNINYTVSHWQDKAEIAAISASAALHGLVHVDSMNDGQGESWRIIQGHLDDIIHDIENMKYLYVMMPYDASRFVYLASAERPDLHGYVDEADVYEYEAWNTLRNGISTSTGRRVTYWGDAISGYAPILDNYGHVVAVLGADLDFGVIGALYRRHAVLNVIMVMATSFVVGLVMRIIMSKAMQKSFNRITSFNISSRADIKGYHVRSSDRESNDWTSALYSHFGDVVNIVDNIQTDIEELLKKHLDGEYDFRLDATRYFDDHAKLAKNINAFADMYVNNFIEVIEVVREYGRGNFDANVTEYKEKWRWANGAIDSLRNKFIHLVSEISDLAENAAKGNFGKQAEYGDHKGKWLDLIKALNKLLTSINDPLSKIDDNIRIMADGDFSRLDGDFHGKFADLRDSCDLVNSRTSSYIDEIALALKEMSGGSLCVRLRQEYVGSYAPIRKSIEVMLESLRKVMTDIHDIADMVAQQADQVSEGASNIAEGSRLQTTYVEELSNSIGIIHDKSSKAQADAKAASSDARLANEALTSGSGFVRQMEENMSRIKTSSENIGQIISKITGIAMQTNLLAVNASIEAARAGEAGKGFSVVAEEVRTLAGRSQESARETEEIITQDLTSVKVGLEMTANVVDVFESFSRHIGYISKLIANISSIFNDQLESLAQAHLNVNEIVNVVTENAAMADMSSQAARDLSAQSELLRSKIAFFRLE